MEVYRKSIKGESRYVWRVLASELRERESCKVISVRLLGGGNKFSKLCRLVLNFLQARHQLPTSGAMVRVTAHGGKSRSKVKRSRFRNGAKSVPKRRKIGDDPVGKTKVASSDEGSFQLYFAASSERVYPKKQTKTFIDWGGAGDEYL